MTVEDVSTGVKVHIAKDGYGRDMCLLRCPGCDNVHDFTGWTWNKDVRCPTISPSILVTYQEGGAGGPVVSTCHSFVEDGKFRFLPDCTHTLAGQVVEVPDWEPGT
jgi:hypothetical protein